MKKIIACLIAISIMISVSSCSSKQDTQGDNGPSDPVDNQTTEQTEQKEEKDEPEKEWGVDQTYLVERNGQSQYIFTKFPELVAINKFTGKCGLQPDGTICMIDGECYGTKFEVTADSVENVFPEFFSQSKDIMDSYYPANYENFDFTIESKELVKINDYDMCKYTGKHTYTIIGDSNTYSNSYVAYAAQAKGNGAYVYIMVLDGTEDQSIGDIVESNAKKIAEALHE